jgi:hypothetical protein
MRATRVTAIFGFCLPLIVSGLSAQQARSPAAPAARSGVMRMRLVKIMDSQGWGQPVEVARLLVPSDWKVEGGVNWVAGQGRCPQNTIQLRWRAVAPDGLTGFEILPQYAWVWSDDPTQQQLMHNSAQSNLACDANPVFNPPDFLVRMVLPRTRPGFRAVRAEPLPKVAQVEQAKLMQSYGPMIQQGYFRGVRAEVGRVRVQYQLNGQAVEEWMSATVQTIAAPSANTAALMNGNAAMTSNNYSVLAYNIYGTWARGGTLDQQDKLFATMMASLRINPGYVAAVAQWLQNIGKMQQQAAIDRQRIWREAQDYISNSIQQTYRENQAVQDRLAEQFGQTIRGVETYIDPRSNEKIELVGGYTTAWSNGKGEYILSDQAGFDPSKVLQEDWREMQRPAR